MSGAKVKTRFGRSHLINVVTTYIYIYAHVYIRDVPFRSGRIRSKSGGVPHETELFRSKLQRVRSDPVRCGPNQMAFRMKTVHSIPCRSRSGRVRSGPVPSGLVKPGLFWSK